MASEHPWWGPARVPFLLLTPACMALGVAWSAWQLAQQGLHRGVRAMQDHRPRAAKGGDADRASHDTTRNCGAMTEDVPRVR